MHDGVFGVAGCVQVFIAGRRLTASSANWRPFIEPGMMTSVNNRSIVGLASIKASASAAFAASRAV